MVDGQINCLSELSEWNELRDIIQEDTEGDILTLLSPEFSELYLPAFIRTSLNLVNSSEIDHLVQLREALAKNETQLKLVEQQYAAGKSELLLTERETNG